MIAVLVPLAVALLGLLLTARAGRVALPLATVTLIGPGLGFSLVSFAFFGWRLVGGASQTFLPAFAFAALGVLALTWSRPAARVGGGVRQHPSSFVGPFGIALFIVASLVTLFLFRLHRYAAPLGQFDAKAIWNAHALLLYRAEEPIAGIFQSLQHGHPSYPLFLPAGIAAQFALLGGDNILTPAVQSLLFTAAAAAAVWAGLHLLGAGRWGPLAGALFLMTPSTQLWGFSQCADMPIAYLFAIAGVGLAVQLRTESRAGFPAWLAGLALGLLPWTKNEGLLLAVVLVAAWCVARWTLSGELRPPWMPVLLGALPGIASLVLFKLFWSPKDEISMFASEALPRALDPERWRIVPAAFWREFNPWTGTADWGIVWPLILVLGLVGWRAFARSPQTRFLGLATALAYLTWFGVYLGTIHDPTWHLETSLDRLLLQLLPLTLVTGFAAVEGRGDARLSHR